MKISCTQESIIQTAALADKIRGRNLTLPVLNSILIHAAKNTIIFRSTNLELGIELNIPASVEEEGTVAVPGSVFVNTLSFSTSGKNIVLETKNDNLVVSDAKSRTIIKSLPHDDFPTLPEVSKNKTFSLKSDALIHGLKSVWYSASTSSVKPELSGIYVHADGNKCLFTATDSFRLAEKAVVAEKLPEFDPFIIPIKNVPEIIRVLEHRNGSVEIRLDPNQIAFVFDGIYLTSRLIDGSFPDYKQIIPKESITEATVLKHDIIQALKKAVLFSDASNQVQCSIAPSKKKFTLVSQNADVGETVEHVSAALSGEALDINFNHRYITDCFQSIASDSITLRFSGIGKPMIVQGVSDKSFLYLVMPMNK